MSHKKRLINFVFCVTYNLLTFQSYRPTASAAAGTALAALLQLNSKDDDTPVEEIYPKEFTLRDKVKNYGLAKFLEWQPFHSPVMIFWLFRAIYLGDSQCSL